MFSHVNYQVTVESVQTLRKTITSFVNI